MEGIALGFCCCCSVSVPGKLFLYRTVWSQNSQILHRRHHHHHNRLSFKYKKSDISNISRRRSCTLCSMCSLKLGFEDITLIAHNKVLIAAGLSAAIGQLFKPFTSSILYGRNFDPKVALQPGGFPSSHSSAVVATATSLALERGLSDSIFGLSVVYASLVIYDAQGVRREVGNHAMALNKLTKMKQVSSSSRGLKDMDYFSDSLQVPTPSMNTEKLTALFSEEGRPVVPNSSNATHVTESANKIGKSGQMLVSSRPAAAEEGMEEVFASSAPLKESVGHSEFEVIAGAFLGFFVSLAVSGTL